MTFQEDAGTKVEGRERQSLDPANLIVGRQNAIQQNGVPGLDS
jgi:hypothetical protein